MHVHHHVIQAEQILCGTRTARIRSTCVNGWNENQKTTSKLLFIIYWGRAEIKQNGKRENGETNGVHTKRE